MQSNHTASMHDDLISHLTACMKSQGNKTRYACNDPYQTLGIGRPQLAVHTNKEGRVTGEYVDPRLLSSPRPTTDHRRADSEIDFVRRQLLAFHLDMANNAMPNGLKRETWRPQPTSSWTPGTRNDSYNRQQHDSPSASGSSSNFRFSPPSGPSRAQYSPPSGPSSSFRPDSDRNHRSRDDGEDERWRSRLDDEDRRDTRPGAADRGGPRDRSHLGNKAPEGPKMGYGRDHIDPGTRAEDRKKGTFRTRAQIEADNRRSGLAPNAHVVPPPHNSHQGNGSARREDRSWSAWRQKVDEGDRRLSGGAMDRATGPERFRHGSPGSGRRDLSPTSETRGRDGRRGSISSSQREVPRGRRPSPDYATGQDGRKRSRSPSRDS